jgi:hypothetical protein
LYFHLAKKDYGELKEIADYRKENPAQHSIPEFNKAMDNFIKKYGSK